MTSRRKASVSERDMRRALVEAVTDSRRRLGWTQRELAHRSGLSQSTVSRLENQLLDKTAVRAALRLLEAMGGGARIGIATPVILQGSRQRDAAHATCVAYVHRRLVRAGWKVCQEVEIILGRTHGWIDLLAFHPATSTLLVIEVKTELHDLGRLQRSLSWYTREAPRAALRLGWRPRRVVGCVLLLATDGNERRLQANRAGLEQAFPCRYEALMALIYDPNSRSGTPGLGIGMIDPASSRQRWIGPARIDGRRTPSPYSDYAGFMRRRSAQCARADGATPA